MQDRRHLIHQFGFATASQLLFVCAIGLCAIGLSAQSIFAAPVNLEYEVKAAFLLNFTKFIDWPAAQIPAMDSPFTICILGDDPFGPVLDQTLQGESVNGHPLVVQRVGRGDLRACQVLYISRSETDVKELLGNVGAGVLTVGEGDVFLRDGGMIGFLLDNRRVRFNISLSATRAGKLTLSSRLLAVAKAVEK